uniref:Polyunsaturated fatty acid synthase n=1 Tax=Pseudoalteromonas sp. DS-12 TaxID=375285 RepID=Q1KML3_9GAMM|nr:polyunsaturated fatty acid synthase [Pseudoalteromonas sp. DS-12]
MAHTEPSDQEANRQKDLRLNKRLADMPIAIVGMASIFANGRYLPNFWDNICEKVDAIEDVPCDHWRIEDYYSVDKKGADKSYCKRGGFMPEVDFNPMEFGLPPNILELTDSSQLLSLIVAKEVLQDANLREDYDRDKIGITLGVGGGQKLSHSLNARLQYPVLDKVFKASGVTDEDSEMIIKKFQDYYVHWEENSFPGSLGNVISGRIANRFDLGGMNCVVDAACAGSLAADRMAITELTEGRSEMMISGGVCTDNSPDMYMSFSKTPAFTTNEQPFDFDSKGMMIGEGIGMRALKRLDDAERDGDRIYAVIKGVGASSDGKFKSIYAPRPEGQAKALVRAYDDAGFAPHSVGLIEAHGTGTAAGDVAEFFGLSSVFSEDNDEKQHIALGSVKSQIGHAKSAAGTAGVIKASLALHHKVLPPTIDIVTQPNPSLEIERSPFYLNTQARPWMIRVDGTPRRAGISSFGFGGTNFHIVLEEYTPEARRGDALKYRQRAVAQILLFTAADRTALLNELNDWAQNASNKDTQPEAHNQGAENYGLRSIAKQAARCGFIANDYEELNTMTKQAITQLEASTDGGPINHWQLPSGISYRAAGLVNGKEQTKVAALFAGQGSSQYLNMGRELACYFPELMQQFHKADQVFTANGKPALSQVLYPIPMFNDESLKAQETILRNTQNAQSAIGVMSVGQFKLFTAAGFNPDMVAGSHFGELSALCAAGVISDDDYIKLAFARGQAMATPSKDGAETDAGFMYAVITKQGDDPEVNGCIAKFEGVSIANYNAPTQVVIAGPTDQTALAADALKEDGFKAIPLPVSGAFHTPLVGHAQKPFADAIDNATFNTPARALYSNGTGGLHKIDANKIKASFKDHMLQSVRFNSQLEMYADGARVFVEFGPKNILTKLVEGTLTNQEDEVCTISINANPKGDADMQLKQAAVQLAVTGISLREIDPYQAVIAPPAAGHMSPMSIKLNATNHISKATRKKMDDSLEDGWVTSQAEHVEREVPEQEVEKIVEKEVIKERIVEVPKVAELPTQGNSVFAGQIQDRSPVNFTAEDWFRTDVLNIGEASLHAFFDAQQQLANLHQQFLAGPKQYGETFSTLMTEQAKMSGIAIPESLDRSMELFHQHQAETLRSHAQYLNMQTGSNAVLGLLNSQTTHPNAVYNSPIQTQVVIKAPTQKPVISPAVINHVSEDWQPAADVNIAQEDGTYAQAEPTVTEVATSEPVKFDGQSALDVTNPQAVMLEVVAEKTGQPTEMLDLEMDMEAPLGIDQIKVEILTSVQDKIAGLPELGPEDLAECRTLTEIVTYMNSKLQATGSNAATPAANLGLSNDKVQATMMAVVAEKTGYPTEMLELEMDMEADLGIDSIKRVEILGTVQDTPGLPELSPEDLAECRTLGEIVDYMFKLPAETGSNAATPAANLGLSNDKVQATMMAVVAEKTGYPTEMLELEMDMEADLGIDSIKRVEILGTVQDTPGLPELSPEDLAECRTLGEIVDYMFKLPAETGSNAATPAANLGLSNDKVQATMMAVVAEKTGYPTEMLELEMDMEADLGIDSIKRVEILGTVQDTPGLPELSPEDLAECRTLGEIVDYMFKLPAETGSNAATPAANLGLSNDKVQATMMAVVAEKTGYPTEMLELEMDMEADLGIDSIKRVEILGTVQDTPGLPELSPEDLAECRTLGEIVDYMFKLPAETGSNAATPAANLGLSNDKVQATMMAVVAEKTGYPTEMLELEMDMEADLGIDSIKRVEILGTVQDTPGLPELSPEDLAECRTLGEIVDYMFKLPAEAANTSALAANPAIDFTRHKQASCHNMVVADFTYEDGGFIPLKMRVESDVPAAVLNKGAAISTVEPNFDLPPHSEVMLKLSAVNKLVQCFTGSGDKQDYGENCVVIDDGHNAGVIAEKLIAQGWKVAVVRPPKGQHTSAPFNSDVASYELETHDDFYILTSICAVIKDIETKQGAIDGFIHLDPLQDKTEVTALELHDQAFTSIMAFLWAKLLQPKLNEGDDARRAFVTVSRIDGGFGFSNTDASVQWDGNIDAELNQAALFGLTKTLIHEWPQEDGVFCRAIDIATKLDARHVADAINSELFDQQGHTVEVGLDDAISKNNRNTLVAGNAGTDPHATKHASAELNKTDVILVTGGAKGVTFECAISLAKQCQHHFILAGRSQEDADALPSWAEGKQTNELKPAAIRHLITSGEKPTPKQVDAFVWPVQSSREINHALAAFEVGASAEYISMDVTNSVAITKALQPLDKGGRSNEITGLIHGAGVLADKHIQDKTLAEFTKVYGTKVNGLEALLAATNPSKQIKHVAMFSSAAGFYGNTGQSDYAMSNDILNKAAYQFKANPEAKVMSFNWGPWDAAMVNPALKKMFTDRGVYVIPLQAGAELLSETGICVQLLVGTSMQGSTNKDIEVASVKKPYAERMLSASDPRCMQVTEDSVRVNRDLDPKAMTFIEDHCINGHAVLPTVCAIAQWMREAASVMLGAFHWVKVRDYKLLKGVIFDTPEDNEPQEYTLELTPVEGCDSKVTAQKQALISCEGRPHTQYKATLVADNAPMKDIAPFDTIKLPGMNASEKAITTEDEAKSLYSNGTLFHGPRLQGITEVLRFDQGLIAKCELPKVASTDCGEFPPQLHNGGSQPDREFAEDYLLQAMLVWARLKTGAASLPSSTIGEFVSYAPMSFGEKAWIELDVIKHTTRPQETSLEANISLYRQNGRLSAVMKSAKVTISKNLNEAFLPKKVADQTSPLASQDSWEACV